MKGIEALQNRMDQSFEKLSDYLDSLSVRERVMVIFTTVFVIVAAVGSALGICIRGRYPAKTLKIEPAKDTIVWMQSNAVTMNRLGTPRLDAAEKVQRVAQQQGLSVASQQMEGKEKFNWRSCMKIMQCRQIS